MACDRKWIACQQFQQLHSVCLQYTTVYSNLSK